MSTSPGESHQASKVMAHESPRFFITRTGSSKPVALIPADEQPPRNLSLDFSTWTYLGEIHSPMEVETGSSSATSFVVAPPDKTATARAILCAECNSCVVDPKKYCTYWIRTGTCDYAAIGCRYKHEMPPLGDLKSITGHKKYPGWWWKLHKHEIEAVKMMSRESQEKANAKAWQITECQSDGALERVDDNIQWPALL